MIKLLKKINLSDHICQPTISAATRIKEKAVYGKACGYCGKFTPSQKQMIKHKEKRI